MLEESIDGRHFIMANNKGTLPQVVTSSWSPAMIDGSCSFLLKRENSTATLLLMVLSMLWHQNNTRKYFWSKHVPNRYKVAHLRSKQDGCGTLTKGHPPYWNTLYFWPIWAPFIYFLFPSNWDGFSLLRYFTRLDGLELYCIYAGIISYSCSQ